MTTLSILGGTSDKDGDRIFYTWHNSDWTFTGGTGKFTGLVGQGVIKSIVRSDAELVARNEGDWEIQ